MTKGHGPGDIPASHAVARMTLGGFVVLLFLAGLALAVYCRGSELALVRTMADTVRTRLLP